MTYYPVIIPTLNRYDHLRQCVESLSHNTHADKTELVIGLDYPPSEKYVDGYQKIKEYIPTISGFKKVTVFERKENYGQDKNYEDLKSYAFANYDALIYTEDDNEFSPCFLDFMNKALERYKLDNRISSVQGYNDSKFSEIKGPNIMFAPSGGVWGVGQWRDKQSMLQTDKDFPKTVLYSLSSSWKIFKTIPAILNMLIAMVNKCDYWDDVTYCCLNILNNRYQVKPRLSMVRNMGNDGSGLHSGIDERFINQKIETAAIFDLDDAELVVDQKSKQIRFYGLLPDNRIKAWKSIFGTVIRYIKFRTRAR